MGSGNSTLSPRKEKHVFMYLRDKYETLKEEGAPDHVAAKELKLVYMDLMKRPKLTSSKTWKKLFDDDEDENARKETEEYQLGDVVQVQGPGSMLFFEGMIIGTTARTVDVQYKNGDDDFEVEFGIPFDSERIRKVFEWNVLERGDTVRVKIGSLGYEGSVRDILQDGNVLVNFGKDGDGEEIEEEHAVENCVKLLSNRMPRPTWERVIKAIQQELQGTKAFMESKSIEEEKIE